MTTNMMFNDWADLCNDRISIRMEIFLNRLSLNLPENHDLIHFNLVYTL